MSKHQSEFRMNLPLAASLAACRTAVAMLGWRLTRQYETGLTCVEVPQTVLSFTNPVQVEIRVVRGGTNLTRIVLNGSIFGFGPFQSNHVRKQIERLTEEIEKASKQASTASVGYPSSASRLIIINGVRLSDEEIKNIEQTYRVRLQDGNFWYDRMTGAWGYRGGPTAGFILPALNLGGSMAEDASNGNTQVFINGRQLPIDDVLRLQQIVPVVLPGRYLMDAQGNFGYEGGPMLGNIWVLATSTGAPREGILSTYDKTGVAVMGGDG